MRALTWQGTEDVRGVDVPEPVLQEPTDAIVRITSTTICGSDLHLYTVLGAFLDAGDVLGHEHRSGASLLGYTKLYGQAEHLRVPQAHYGPVKVPDDGSPDERYLYLSDVLPTAWQAVQDLTAGRGTDSVIDAVGMEAHGSPIAQGVQLSAGLLPDAAARSRSRVSTAALWTRCR